MITILVFFILGFVGCMRAFDWSFETELILLYLISAIMGALVGILAAYIVPVIISALMSSCSLLVCIF